MAGHQERFQNAITCLVEHGSEHFLGWEGSYDVVAGYVSEDNMVSCVPRKAGQQFSKELVEWRKNEEARLTVKANAEALHKKANVEALQEQSDSLRAAVDQVVVRAAAQKSPFPDSYFQHYIKVQVPVKTPSGIQLSFPCDTAPFLYFRHKVLKRNGIQDFARLNLPKSTDLQAWIDAASNGSGLPKAKKEMLRWIGFIHALFVHGAEFFLGYSGDPELVQEVVPADSLTCCVQGRSCKSFYTELTARGLSDASKSQPSSSVEKSQFTAQDFANHIKVLLPAKTPGDDDSFFYFRHKVLQDNGMQEFARTKLPETVDLNVWVETAGASAALPKKKKDIDLRISLVDALFLHGQQYFLGYSGNTEEVRHFVSADLLRCCVQGRSCTEFFEELRARGSVDENQEGNV